MTAVSILVEGQPQDRKEGMPRSNRAHSDEKVLHSLPSPTGRYNVGRHRYHWTDPARLESLSLHGQFHRELNVDLWYPTQAGGPEGRAPYLPGTAAIRAALGEKIFTDEFNSAADLVVSGSIETHTFVDPSLSAANITYPVLVFSHGLGVPSTSYTVQMEALASDGFIIAAIEHTYDSFASVFPDGRVIDYEDAEWEKRKNPDEHATYTIERAEVWARDIRFVIDQLMKLNASESASLFSGHLDMSALGAFGHSLGGLAALRACQTDARIRACLDQDSLIYGTPFVAKAEPLSQPTMIVLTTSNFAPTRTDAQLARGGISRTVFESNIQKFQEQLTQSLARQSGDCYIAVITSRSFEHMGFSDFPLLQAQDQEQAKNSATGLQTAIQVTRTFFAKYLADDVSFVDSSISSTSGVTILRIKH